MVEASRPLSLPLQIYTQYVLEQIKNLQRPPLLSGVAHSDTISIYTPSDSKITTNNYLMHWLVISHSAFSTSVSGKTTKGNHGNKSA